MLIVDGDYETVIVAFDVEHDSIRSNDARTRIVFPNVGRTFPMSPKRLMKPSVEGRLDGLVVFGAFEAVDELPESFSRNHSHGRVWRDMGGLYTDVPNMGTERKWMVRTLGGRD
jgi:hypothetical protein